MSPIQLSRTSLILILLLTTSKRGICVPVRPLNERSTEVMWQAWLLIDEQNQNNNTQDDGNGVQRRRITPKSIFIIPNRHGTLPPCAEGYTADVMGRCNMSKKITIDVDESDKFLLDFLFKKFGEQTDYSMEESEEVKSTPGPVQFKFSLDENADVESTEDEVPEDSKEEEQDGEEGEIQKDEKKDELAVVSDINRNVLNVESTTPSTETTTKYSDEHETETYETSSSENTETTTIIETTTTIFGEEQALFFLEPLAQPDHVENYSKENATDAPNDNVTTTMRTNTNDSLTTSQTTLSENNKQNQDEQTRYVTETKQTQDDVTESSGNANLVRFPSDDEPASFPLSYAPGHGHWDPVETQDAKRDLHVAPETAEYGSHHVFNHRNRDKHLWRTSSSQPSVFRFPRRHGNSRHLLDEDESPGKRRRHRS